MSELTHEIREALRAMAQLPKQLEVLERLFSSGFKLLHQEIVRMSTTVDTIQAETAGLQAKFTSLKTAVDGFISSVGTKISALSAQIAALQSAGVDPALLAPLATLQTDMQSEIDAVSAASSGLNPPPPATDPAPTA